MLLQFPTKPLVTLLWCGWWVEMGVENTWRIGLQLCWPEGRSQETTPPTMNMEFNWKSSLIAMLLVGCVLRCNGDATAPTIDTTSLTTDGEAEPGIFLPLF